MKREAFMNSEQFKEAQELVQIGFFDMKPVASNGNSEIAIIADWSGLSKEEATNYHVELEKREKQLDAIISFAEEQRKSVICEKSDLYSYMKATRSYDEWLVWLKYINVSYRSAQECIQMGTEYRTELTCTSGASRLLSRNQIRAIHRTGEGHDILAKVNSGDVKPNWEDLNKEIEAANQRTKEAEEKLEEERKAREEDQKQHSLFKDEVETNEQAHVTLVQSLEQKLEEKPEPEKIIEYEKVIEYQDTLETASKIAELETLIELFEAKPDIPPEKQKELEDLQRELKNAKTELGFYEEQNKALAEHVKQLGEESRRSFTENIAIVGQLRIRQEWQFATGELQASVRKFHTRIPSEIDRESFEGEEHNRTAETIEVLEQTIKLIKKTLLGSDSTIDADTAIPAIPQYQAALPGPDISIDPQALFAQYQQFVKSFPEEKLWWRAPQCGIKDMEMDKDLHIHYTRELLKSGDPFRITAAIEGMRRTLGYSMVG
jgi:hypothetical protein